MPEMQRVMIIRHNLPLNRISIEWMKYFDALPQQERIDILKAVQKALTDEQDDKCK